jgi:hypothetical protein
MKYMRIPLTRIVFGLGYHWEIWLFHPIIKNKFGFGDSVCLSPKFIWHCGKKEARRRRARGITRYFQKTQNKVSLPESEFTMLRIIAEDFFDEGDKQHRTNTLQPGHYYLTIHADRYHKVKCIADNLVILTPNESEALHFRDIYAALTMATALHIATNGIAYKVESNNPTSYPL